MPQDVTDGKRVSAELHRVFKATSGKTLEVIVKEISVDKGSDLAQTSAKLKRKTQVHASN